MLKGYISITANPNILSNAICSGTKIVAMKDNLNTNEYFGVEPIQASLLLPPYESIAAFLEGDIESARNIYFSYLSQKEQDMYICALIAASMKGINILIYTDIDMYEMKFAQLFYEYMVMTFGVAMISEEQPMFMYDPAFTSVNLGKLYFYDFITSEVFFILYPAVEPLPMSIIPKLVIEINPYVVNNTEVDYYNYFYNYKENMKINNNNVLTIPVLMKK